MSRHHGFTRNTCSATLYVVDVENMACSDELDVAAVGRIRQRILAAVPYQAGDHTVLATSHHNAAAAWLGWAESAQRLVRSGKDGADRELIEVMSDVERIVSRYARVVLATGDGAFAYPVAALKTAECRVLVIPPDVGFSKRLAVAAGPDVVRLGSPIPDNVISIFRTTKATA